MGLPDVLAYTFLINTNISEHHKQLVWATVSELKCNTMKEQLKKSVQWSIKFYWVSKGRTKYKSWTNF